LHFIESFQDSACLPAALGRRLPNAGHLRPQIRDESVNILSKCPKAQATTFTRWPHVGKSSRYGSHAMSIYQAFDHLFKNFWWKGL
jgi:hypothetical protein